METNGGDSINTSTLHPDYYDYYYDYHYNDTDGVVPQGLQIYRWILVVGVIPVCVLGLAANTVSVWVWNTARNRPTIVLLFQSLGVLDNVFLLISAVRGALFYQNPLDPYKEIYMLPLLYLSQTLSVHVTMIIGVFRWLAVAKPRRSQPLTRRHVLMACGGVGGWCSLLTVLLIVAEVDMEFHNQPYVITTVVLQVVGFVLPTLVLLVFSVLLLRITFQHQRLQSKKKHLRTTLAVLSIATSSFLACPVGVAGHLLALFASGSTDSKCTLTCVFSALGAGDLLQVLNSSVNFLFYFFFASKFRPLLHRALCCCGPCTNAVGSTQRKFSTTSNISQLATDSGSLTGSISVQAPEGREEDPHAADATAAAAAAAQMLLEEGAPGEVIASGEPAAEAEATTSL